MGWRCFCWCVILVIYSLAQTDNCALWVGEPRHGVGQHEYENDVREQYDGDVRTCGVLLGNLHCGMGF